MQECAEMVAWVKQYSDLVTNETNNLVTVCQDAKDIHLSCFEYRQNFVRYINGNAGVATLFPRAFGEAQV